jgi:toxin ParE1/3/4
LREIGLWIAAHNPAASLSMLGRIRKSAASLRRHPHLGRIGRIEGTRELVIPSSPYIVAYRIYARRVEILAVWHGARECPESFEKGI